MRPSGLAVAFALVATPAPAATLRPMTTLVSPVVLLRDLFDDAGPQGSRVLGPGPAPGERIVVGAAQLDAIARQFGVDWRSSSSADRAVLDQPGRLLPREPLLAALRLALQRVGAPAAIEVELQGFQAPLVPLAAEPRVLVEQLDYQSGADRFAASLLVDGAAMTPLRLAVSGQVDELVEVAVPLHRLAGGSVLRAADLTLASVRASLLRGEVAREPAQAVGLALRRPALQGQPLLLADLSRPLAVAKGARVAMELAMPGLVVLAQGVALDAGALGDRIQVLNPTSRLVVEGEIVGHGRVAVAQGSVAAPLDGRLADAQPAAFAGIAP